MHVTVVLVCCGFVLLGSCPYRSNASVLGRSENALARGRVARQRPANQAVAIQNDDEDEESDEAVYDQVPYGNNGQGYQATNGYYEQAQQAVNKDHGDDAVEDEEQNGEMESEEFNQDALNNQVSGPVANDADEEDCNEDDEECDTAGGGNPDDEEGDDE